MSKSLTHAFKTHSFEWHKVQKIWCWPLYQCKASGSTNAVVIPFPLGVKSIFLYTWACLVISWLQMDSTFLRWVEWHSSGCVDADQVVQYRFGTHFCMKLHLCCRLVRSHLIINTSSNWYSFWLNLTEKCTNLYKMAKTLTYITILASSISLMISDVNQVSSEQESAWHYLSDLNHIDNAVRDADCRETEELRPGI